MFKLINASLDRIKKNLVFHMILVINIVFCLFVFINNSSYSLEGKRYIDSVLFRNFLLMGLLMALFTSMFGGIEYSFGTLRNKIIVGHKRKSIYLSNLISSMIVFLIIEIVYIVIALSLGAMMTDGLKNSLDIILIEFFKAILVILAFVSLFNLITMSCSNITISVTICLVLYIALYVFGSNLSMIVISKEYIENSIINEKGEVVIEKVINPNYPGKEKIRLAKNVYYCTPMGGMLDIPGGTQLENDVLKEDLNANNGMMITYLLLDIIIYNAIGIFIFNRKDFK